MLFVSCENNWSRWNPFPAAEMLYAIDAPIGPGVYELRLADTREPVYCGKSVCVSTRMQSLLPKPWGKGTRNNAGLRSFVLENSENIEYRTVALPTDYEAQQLETFMKRKKRYLFHT